MGITVANATSQATQRGEDQTMSAANKLSVGAIVRLGPWTGRLVDTLVSDITGERYGRVQFVKHAAGVTEVHPLAEFKLATLQQMQREIKARLAQIEVAHKELVEQVNGIEGTTISRRME